MSDFISRQALLAEYDKHHVGAPGMARKLIADAPTIDAVPVVHGHWVWDEESECWLCTKCGYAALNNYRGNSVDSNYCPNCGAKMDGEADE